MIRQLKMAKNIPVIAVLGSTGAGKSKLALEIAEKYSAEIISTDSMQASWLGDKGGCKLVFV